MQLSQSDFSQRKEKILLYITGSLGDTLVAIPAVRAVRRNFPDAELILLQHDPLGHNAEISQIIPDELVDGYLSYNTHAEKADKISIFRQLWSNLRKQNFQAAVYLVSSERPARSVRRDKLFFRSCGIKRLIGFHPFSKDKLYPLDSQNRPALTISEAELKLERLRLDGIKTSEAEDFQLPLLKFSKAEIETAEKWLATRRKKPHSRLISIAPGCKNPANYWSLENFIEIGQKLLDAEDCELVVIGGKTEHSEGEKMVSAWNSGINAAGQFSVRESGALLSLSDFHIGVDTGTTHLAAAVGTRCFAIYHERYNPGYWHPLGNQHTIIYHPVPCAGCRGLSCPLPDHPCMKNISVEAVWRNLRVFMREDKSGRNGKSLKRIAV